MQKLFNKKLLCAAVSISLFGSLPAQAAELSSDDSVDDKSKNKVVITGSRIKRVDVQGVQSIKIFSSEDIEQSGLTDIGEFLSTISSAGGATNQTFNTSSTVSATQVNLRNVGANKTLVLLNGVRVPTFAGAFGGSSNTVDMGSLPPLSAVQRVEVLTDAASAIYGSDAMAGVINVILKEDYQGNRVEVRYEDTEQNDRSKASINFVTGLDFGDGWDGLFTLGFEDREGFSANGRPEYLGNGPFGTASLSTWGAYLRDYGRVYHDSTRIVPNEEECNALLGHRARYIDNTWTGYPDVGEPNSTVYKCRTDRHTGREIYAGVPKKINTTFRLSKQLKGGDEFTFNLAYMDRKTVQDREPRGMTSFFYHDAATGTNSFTRVNSTDERYYLRRSFVEFEDRYRNTVDADSLMSWATYSGDLTDDMSYNVTYSYGDNNRTRVGGRFPISQELLNAITFDPNDTTPGSWYPLSRMTPDIVEKVGGFKTTKSSMTIQTLSFDIAGEFLNLDNGPVDYAVIAEVFSEDWKDWTNDEAYDGGLVGTGGNRARGDRLHYALGGELELPVTSFLTLSLAGRYDYYDDDTEVDGAFSPSAKAIFDVSSNQKIRIGWGESFKAPDLARVYAEPSQFFSSTFFINGACDAAQIAAAEAGTPQNCNPREILNTGNVSYDRTVAGNKALKEETGETINLAWVGDFGDFSAVIEAYQLKFKGEVNTISTTEILENTNASGGYLYDFTAQGTSGTDCASLGQVGFLTEPATYTDTDTGAVFNYQELACLYAGPVNIAFKTTRGVDFSTKYILPTSFGKFTFNLKGSFTDKLESLENDKPETEVVDELTESFENQWKGSFSVYWRKADWSAYMRTRYIGTAEGELDNYIVRDPETGVPVDGVDEIDGYHYKWDAYTDTTMNLSYRGIEDTRITFGINNVFDESPSRQDAFRGGNSFPYASKIKGYDYLGRRFYLKATYNF